MIFDAPKMKAPFKKRLDKMKKVVEECKSEYVQVLEHTICKSIEHLNEEMDRIIAKKGEGVMLRDPESLYEGRRSDKLLKVKKFDDAEATVIGHEKGTGRCSGMLGALRVRMDNGIEFKIGSGFNDAQRMKPPKIGSKVTFKFMGKSNKGTPRFPIFLRVHPGM
jgi:DNA ligase-1